MLFLTMALATDNSLSETPLARDLRVDVATFYMSLA
jgi:hypothetical protein